MQHIERPLRVIGLASTSKRRQQALEQIPGLQIQSVPGGEEAQIDDVLSIALQKITFAYPTLLQLCQNTNQVLDGVVAADTHTVLGVLQISGHPSLRSEGKPTEVERVKQHFHAMATCARETGYGYYKVVSASAVQDAVGTLAQLTTTKVALKQSGLTYLVSEQGFSEYLDQFSAFYCGSAYNSYGLHGVTPLDISAGISLPVLSKMRILESVGGVDLRTARMPEIRLALKLGVLNAAIGFAPEVLTRIQAQAMHYIMDWPWLNSVTDSCLET